MIVGVVTNIESISLRTRRSKTLPILLKDFTLLGNTRFVYFTRIDATTFEDVLFDICNFGKYKNGVSDMSETLPSTYKNITDEIAQISSSLSDGIELPTQVSLRELAKTASESIKNISGLADALNISKDFSNQLSGSLEQVKNLVLDDFSDIQDTIIPLQPQVYEAIQSFFEKISSSVLPAISGIDFLSISESFKKKDDSNRFISVLAETQWPLFLVESTTLRKSVLLSVENAGKDDIAGCVYSTARAHLNSQWLDETRNLWSQLDFIIDEKKALLYEALKHHSDGDYYGCVAILMCLLDGFVKDFSAASVELSEVQTDLLDQLASEHNLDPYTKKDKKKRKLNSKDYVLIMLILIPEGWNVWKAATTYIVDIVLANKDSEELHTHNPLRHKICHGEQTNYGTWEHSIKSILVTDLILRLIDVAYLALNARDIGEDEK